MKEGQQREEGGVTQWIALGIQQETYREDGGNRCIRAYTYCVFKWVLMDGVNVR